MIVRKIKYWIIYKFNNYWKTNHNDVFRKRNLTTIHEYQTCEQKRYHLNFTKEISNIKLKYYKI